MKINKPMVSVIMAAHNDEVYLETTILSVLGQTLNDFEFIITDDGSKDGSLKIIKSFASKDKRIRVVENLKGIGLASSLNNMIGLAKADYIARMDSDDICISDRFEKQIDFLKKNPKIGILGGQAILINQKNIEIGRLNKPSNIEKLEKYLIYRCPVIHPTYMVSREVYKELGGYRKISPGQDYDFLLRAYQEKIKIINTKDYVIRYRVNYSGISHGNLNRSFWHTYYIKKMYSLRVKGKDDSHILEWLMKDSCKESQHLKNLHQWKNKARDIFGKKNMVNRILLTTALIFFTLLDFRAIYNSYLSLKTRKLVD